MGQKSCDLERSGTDERDCARVALLEGGPDVLSIVNQGLAHLREAVVMSDRMRERSRVPATETHRSVRENGCADGASVLDGLDVSRIQAGRAALERSGLIWPLGVGLDGSCARWGL